MSKKPTKLNKGDTIGVIAPAGAVKEGYELFNKRATKLFNDYGYNVKISQHAFDKNNYLASTDENKLKDLHSFFEDDNIKAILSTRGGYGCSRLLDKINFDLIKNNPKIFVGYSDLTTLLNSFLEKSDLITFHGPLFLPDFGAEAPDEYTLNSFFNILEGKITFPHLYQNNLDYTCIAPGIARGKLIGGNLTVLCSLLGTKYFPDVTDKILLLEEIGEQSYKIDRLLTQLKLAGVFEKAKGVIFGEFTSINDEFNLTPVHIIKDTLKNINIPMGYGFHASHSTKKATLPFGVEYIFNSENFELQLIENCLKI